MPSQWDELVAEAQGLGYEVLLVEYIECADCPGLLGMAEGAIIYAKGIIRIRECLSEDDRVRVLRHELEHARNPGKDIEEGPVWFLSDTGKRREST